MTKSCARKDLRRRVPKSLKEQPAWSNDLPFEMRGLRSVSGDRRDRGVYGNVTLLVVIVPVCVVDLEICFAEGSHERDLPQDGL